MYTPSVGRIVHYTSYGTPGGEYDSKCRTAVVTEVDPEVVGKPRTISLAVLNPTATDISFNSTVLYIEEVAGGTWHWPERT